MAEPKEPQSYGSEKGWVEGKTGQEVNRQKDVPDSQHADFYESSRQTRVGPEGGGFVSPEQAAENVEPTGAATGGEDPVKKVSASRTGTKTGSYFKKRDYS
jgi:hypothetical protein